jgi:deazaflavin-dependent oxidoreductase (nitroreductase family)
MKQSLQISVSAQSFTVWLFDFAVAIITFESHMPAIHKKSVLWYLFRAPVYLYRWHLGWLFGRRCLMLSHTGRRTGLRRRTVLEVVEYREKGPEVVVANGFGPDCDWVRNIQAHHDAEVTVGRRHFSASYRFLNEEEAAQVIRDYERRNRFIAPVVRRGFSWLLGWRYHGGEDERRQLVHQIPLIAFRPRVS